MAENWQSLNLGQGNTKAIKSFLKDIDNVVKVVKTLAQLAHGNIAFLQMLLKGLSNPLFIAIQILAQAIEDYVNSLFGTGLWYMIIDPTNVDLKRIAKQAEGAKFNYPGLLLNDIMSDNFEDTLSFEVLQMVLGVGPAQSDSQKVRDAESDTRPEYVAEQMLRPYELESMEFVRQRQATMQKQMMPEEKKALRLRFLYNRIKDNTFLTYYFVTVYGEDAKRIVDQVTQLAGSNAAIQADGTEDNVIGSTARMVRFLSDAGMAYVGKKASVLGLVSMTPQDVLASMATAIDDPGDFNRPGAPNFILHTSKDQEGRKETLLKNPEKWFYAKNQLLQFEAILSNAKTSTQVDVNLVSSLESKISGLKGDIANIEKETITSYGKLNKPKKDLYGRPRMMGFNSSPASSDPFQDNDGAFPMSDYEGSLSQELDSGFSKYSGIIFMIGAPRLDGIPIGIFEMLGYIFGGGFNSVFADAIARVTNAFSAHTRQKTVQLRNVCMVKQAKPPSEASQADPTVPKMKVQESHYRIRKGTLLIGEQSKNTMIVLENQKTEREVLTAIDDKGNKYNPYAVLTAAGQNMERRVNADNQSSFNLPGTGSSTTDFTAEDVQPVYSAQKLLIAPYDNSAGRGQYDPVNGKAFQDGELIYVAYEENDGTIDIDRSVAGQNTMSIVCGNFQAEFQTPMEYNFPPSKAPDFNGKITLAEMMPDFAFALRSAALGFANMLRGFVAGGGSAVDEIMEMLENLIKYLTELANAILRFLAWFEALATLSDAGIYAVTFTANGKTELKKKLKELGTVPSAPPRSLKYTSAVLLLGAEADTSKFINFLNTNQAFKNWEAARDKFATKLEEALARFQEDAAKEFAEVMRRSGHFESQFKDDYERNTDSDTRGQRFPSDLPQSMVTGPNFEVGADSKFDNGGAGYAAELAAENAAFGDMLNQIPATANAGYFGFSGQEMLESTYDIKFFWKISVERLTAQEELSQNIVGYRLYWATSSLDANENLQFSRDVEIYTFDDNDFTKAVDVDTPLEIEIQVGQGTIPTGTTHLVLVSVAGVTDKLGNQTRYIDVESLELHAIPISTGLPLAPEVIVNEPASSLSLNELYITRLEFEIQDLDNTGDDDQSTVLGYRIFFADSSLKQIDTKPFKSIPKPASGANVTVVLEDVELKSATFAEWDQLLVFAENQNGYSPPVYFPLNRITAALDKAQQAVFTDVESTRGNIGGNIAITPGTHTSINGIDTTYRVFFGTRNPTTNVISQIGTQVGTDISFRGIDGTGRLNSTVPTQAIPDTATHFMVFTSLQKFAVPGQTVMMRESLNININDLGDVPAFQPTSLIFNDTDSTLGTVTGTFTIGPAGDEQLIDNYIVYFGDNSFRRVDATGKSGNGQAFLTNATQDANGCIITVEDANHGAVAGDYVLFNGVAGMTELNGNKYYVSPNGTEIALFTDANMNNPLDSGSFTPYTSGGSFFHDVNAINDDDVAELNRAVTAVPVPDTAAYYMVFSKNGFGESRQYAFDVVVDPQYPNEPGEIIEIDKSIVKVLEIN